MTKRKKIIQSIFQFPLSLLGKTRLPKLQGQVKISGLQSEVDIYRDNLGIPYIFAQNQTDLFFTQGFVHAQDRLWQLEFNRRFVSGRMSEIIGNATVPLDRWLRTLRMYDTATKEVPMIKGNSLKLLEAYAAGINYFISHFKLPIEFLLLRYKPEPWQIADTLAWVKMMSWSLSVNWESELLRANLVEVFGKDLASELEPPHLIRWPYIIPPGTDFSKLNTLIKNPGETNGVANYGSPRVGVGSNSWVISGNMTEDGLPILANDMHLMLSIPSIWYENQLITEDNHITGITFPGIPGIISGHNGNVAWGFTNGFADVQDLYIEHLKEDQDGSILVEYNGKWEKASVIKEEIKIKGHKSECEEVILTRHGPIINSLSPDLITKDHLALKWTSLDPNPSIIDGLFEMIYSRDSLEFHNALKKWTSPVQNVVYADTQGNIGYTLAGNIPVRAKGNGRIPVPGWIDDYEWVGYIPFEGLPHLYNPPQGYIITANNDPIPDNYPIRIDIEAISGDRAQRIAELIVDLQNRIEEDNTEKITISDIRKMQYDQHSTSARHFSRYIGALPIEKKDIDSKYEKVIKMFKDWDGELSTEKPQALIYKYLTQNMVTIILESKIKNSHSFEKDQKDRINLTERIMGKGPTPFVAEVGLFGEHWLPWLINQLEHPKSHWFNLGNNESRDDILSQSLRKTIQELEEKFGEEIQTWSWGKVHRLHLKHNLAASNYLESYFNCGPYPIGGDHTTIWASGNSYHTIQDAPMIGPPFKMIINLSNLNSSKGLLMPGQSGHPSSKFYSNQINDWFTGTYHTLLFDIDEIKNKSENHLKLKPVE
jgi:penicillin G amidase